MYSLLYPNPNPYRYIHINSHVLNETATPCYRPECNLIVRAASYCLFPPSHPQIFVRACVKSPPTWIRGVKIVLLGDIELFQSHTTAESDLRPTNTCSVHSYLRDLSRFELTVQRRHDLFEGCRSSADLPSKSGECDTYVPIPLIHMDPDHWIFRRSMICCQCVELQRFVSMLISTYPYRRNYPVLKTTPCLSFSFSFPFSLTSGVGFLSNKLAISITNEDLHVVTAAASSLLEKSNRPTAAAVTAAVTTARPSKATRAAFDAAIFAVSCVSAARADRTNSLSTPHSMLDIPRGRVHNHSITYRQRMRRCMRSPTAIVGSGAFLPVETMNLQALPWIQTRSMMDLPRLRRSPTRSQQRLLGKKEGREEGYLPQPL
jgi:hypothetical protein